jgi:cell division protein FtsB
LANQADTPAGGGKNLLTIGLVILVLLMSAYAVFGNRGVLRIMQAQRQQQELRQQLAELEAEKQQLRRRIERLQQDRDYWEHLARTRLGMVREGELIYHLPDQSTADQKAIEE